MAAADISILIMLHVVSTIYMTGLIWFVQVVHYPLFSAVGKDQFINYERRHQSRTSFVVILPMLLELSTGAAIWWISVQRFEPTFFNISLLLLVVVWLSTFLIQVPLHSRLDQGFNEQAHKALVRSNWLRTAAWTGRAVLVALEFQFN